MRQGKINVAFRVLCDLYRVKGLPFSLSSMLFNQKRNLQPFVEHYNEAEAEVLEKWDAITPAGTVRTDMPMAEVAKINKELDEIRATDVEYDVTPITIVLNDELTEKLGVTGEIIEQLDGFVNFVEMEDDEE